MSPRDLELLENLYCDACFHAQALSAGREHVWEARQLAETLTEIEAVIARERKRQERVADWTAEAQFRAIMGGGR